MPQQTTGYRPTPANPTTTVEPKTRDSAIEDLDDFLDEVDDILTEEEAFAVNYRQKGGQ
jgi:ubiquitin-like protein Pup